MTDTLVVLPNTEALVINALLAQPEAAEFGGRIYSVVPKERAFPMARVQRVAGGPVYNEPYWLDGALVQIDVWADSSTQAQRLAEVLRALCAQRLVGTHPEGVASHPQLTALLHLPDPSFSSPRPRYIFTLTINTHPSPGALVTQDRPGAPVDERRSRAGTRRY
jgi:hypothetical protein